MTEEVKKEEVKKKGPLEKLKEFSHDKEEQMEIFSTFVRLGILIWSGGILTLNYVDPSQTSHKKILIRHLSLRYLQEFWNEISASRQQRIKMLLLVEVVQTYLRKIWRCL